MSPDNTEIFDNDKITKIIDSYKKRRERDRAKYLRNKDDPNFVQQNRARAKAHYDAHYKETKKINYQNNKEFNQVKSLYYYYKRTNKIDQFMKKYPQKIEILTNHGFSIDSGSGSGSA